MKKSDETNVILKKFQNSDQEGYLRIAKDEGVKEFCNIFYAETLDDAEFVIKFSSMRWRFKRVRRSARIGFGIHV